MDSSCHGCIKGSIHSGQPKGTEETIHGLNTYVVGNRTNPRAIIVIYSDIFGLLLPNNKLIADAYASSGEYLVYLPDFFKGDPCKLDLADVLIPVDASKQSTLSKYTGLLANIPSFLMWQSRHKPEPTEKFCNTFLGKLRRNSPGLKIGMAGFCWGGRFAMRAGLESNMIDINGTKTPLVDAAVAIHPSNLKLPGDAEKIIVPTTYAWGVEDSVVSFAQKAQVEEIHAKASKAGAKVPEMEHRTYKPGRHGFGVRGNPDDPLEKACLEGTEEQGKEWFKRWL